MAQPELISRMAAPQVYEGTPGEIAERLRDMDSDKKLTLIIPGEELTTPLSLESDSAEQPCADQTFAQILSPLQEDFEASGMTDAELGELIDAELEAYRAERKIRKQTSDG